MVSKDDPARLWGRAIRQPVEIGSCLEWQGARTFGGYGLLMWHGERRRRAHRVAYELANGPIPPGLHVLHRCDNPPCIEPSHLFVGTNVENQLDRIRKKRGSLGLPNPPSRNQRGSANNAARLDERSVRAIRSLAAAGVFQRVIADAFGVRRATVSAVLRGKNWSHV